MKKNITRSQNHHLNTSTEHNVLEHISLKLLFRKWWNNIRKLFTLVQFYFHKFTFGIFQNVKLPWFKISVLAFGVFLMVKKDLHFQINMRAPSYNTAQPASYQASESLSMTPSFNFIESTSSVSISNDVLSAQEVEHYIKRFGKVAIMEAQKFGVPASIKMAQALLESQAGKARATTQDNNHFGKPLQGKKYESAWENWRAHSWLFSTEGQPYQQLLQHGKDYKKWAQGLQELNYSNRQNYANLLIELIEKYELFRLDSMKL
ncbi:MAG: glucosaminidase domain-containing protein [Bacteroidota bacterium]